MRAPARPFVVGLLAALAVAWSPTAHGTPDGARTSPATLERAGAIEHEVSARYRRSAGAGLAVRQGSSTEVVESVTLLSPPWDEVRTIPADNGVFYAVCAVGATCPYPVRELARSPATFLPRRIALELAARTFLATEADLVVVSLPTPRFVVLVVERSELGTDAELAALVEELGPGPLAPPSTALRALVDGLTRPRTFAFLTLDATAAGGGSFLAVAVWSDAR